MRRFNAKYTRTARPVVNFQRNRTNSEVFGVLLKRYREIQGGEIRRGAVMAWREREFCADFELLARRCLSPRQYTVFRLAYIWGLGDESVMARLDLKCKLDLMLATERIESLIGAACRSTKPYPLYPLDEYFRDPERKESSQCQQPGSVASAARQHHPTLLHEKLNRRDQLL